MLQPYLSRATMATGPKLAADLVCGPMLKLQSVQRADLDVASRRVVRPGTGRDEATGCAMEHEVTRPG
jgi:hypothetical protein